MFKQRLKPITKDVSVDGGGGSTTTPNTLSLNSFADRAMTQDEVLWSHALPVRVFIPQLALLSTSSVDVAPLTEFVVTFRIADFDLGTLTFGPDSTTGTYVFNENQYVDEGQVIDVVVTKAAGNVNNLTISLLTEIQE